jgi:integrase
LSDKEERADMRVDEEDFISNVSGLGDSAQQSSQTDAEAVISAALGSAEGFAARRLAGPVSFSDYIATQFLPGHVALKSSPGKRHYFAILKHVIKPAEVDFMAGSAEPRSRAKLTEDPNWPYLGDLAMEHISPGEVGRLVEAALHRGYSPQTVRHIRNVVRSAFAYAIAHGFFSGVNPATGVAVPDSEVSDLHVLTLAETMQVLELMRYPEREVALMAILTNMTISEICGLQWKNVNLTDHALSREGLTIPARHIAIRTQWYRGQLAPVPPARRKFIPLPPLMLRVIRCLSNGSAAGWNDFVLTTRSGRPINQINLAGRRLKRIGQQVNMPWLSWQVFRRTRLSILHEYETRVQEQLARVIFPTAVPIAVHQFGPKEQ